MVKMPWNRNITRPGGPKVPQEVEEYYQSTHQQKRGIAWALMLSTVLFTFVIGVGLFMGGRWVYRAIFSKDTTNLVTPSASEDTLSDNANENNTNTAEEQSTSVDEPSTATSEDEASQPEPFSRQTTPVSGSSDSQIPQTGPTDILY